MPFEANIPQIPNSPVTNNDLPSTEFPGLSRIASTDLVGPLAANKQEKALEKRDETLRDRINRLINNVNLIDSLYLPRSEADAIIVQLIQQYGLLKTGDTATGAIKLPAAELLTDPSSAARLDMVVKLLDPGIQAIIGKLQSAITLSSDPATTLTTKGYVDSSRASIPNRIATYTTSGTYIFTVPVGVTKIYAGAVGGSGGGGGRPYNGGRGGDGAGGGSVIGEITVTPGDTLTLTVGGGGGFGKVGDTIHGASGGGGGGGSRVVHDASGLKMTAGGGGGGGGGADNNDGNDAGGRGGSAGQAGANPPFGGTGAGAGGFGIPYTDPEGFGGLYGAGGPSYNAPGGDGTGGGYGGDVPGSADAGAYSTFLILKNDIGATAAGGLGARTAASNGTAGSSGRIVLMWQE